MRRRFGTSVVHTLIAVTAFAGCSKEEYGFVARLGNDTTSIERITRTGDRIVSDVVEHSPRVIKKHWEATLNDDGSIRRWTMDAAVLNPDAGEPAETQYTVEFGTDSVLVVQGSGSSARRYVIRDVLPVTVPWDTYVYGLYELLFAAAVAQPGDTVSVTQYMPGYGAFQKGLVRKQPDGSITFVTGGLAGTGVATLDEHGRMMHYSGKHTTFKQEVERVESAPDIDRLAEHFAAHERAAPVRSLSVRDTTRAVIGRARISVEYGRPLKRGREILGNVVPYGVVWRTGANAATHLTTTAPISIAGIELPRGTYTLWTQPNGNGAALIISGQTRVWGTRYNPKYDIGRAAMVTEQLAQPVEQFTIRIEPIRGGIGTLILEWDRFRWTAPIRVE